MTATAQQKPGMPRLKRLRGRLRELYHGGTPQAVRFRVSLLILDFILIGFFIAAPFFRTNPTFLALDYLIALALALDLAARGLAATSFRRWVRRTSFWVDLVVLVTLLFPLWLYNFAFLRVLRLYSLVHSELFWETVAPRYDNTRWEQITKAVATLVTHLFIVTGFVYALYAQQHPDIDGYVDALYFTVSSLTTTGYGDIVLPGTWGRLISILIMISGITLFLRLAQALFRPHKVRFACPTCGLLRHDPDAVHCKACGTLLNIPNEE